MKLVQFIYPMFLVALGLHALLLFVPIGEATDPDSVAVEEDVPLPELSDQPTPDPAGELPVPDLNVSAESPGSAAAQLAIAAPSVAATSSPSAVRSAPPRRPVASAPNRVTTPTTSPPTQTDSASSAAPADPSGSSSSPTTYLPDLSAGDQDSEESTPDESRLEAAPEDAASPSAENEPASGLIASASGEPPESLQQLAAAFAKALDYNPEGTDEASAERELADWQASIRRQASVDGVENIEPTQIAELTPIRYPIESAEKADGRPFSVCLEKGPHSAEVGVLFDSQGQIAGEPKLIRSTGYSALNEEIIAAVANYGDFPDGHQSKAYTFEVEVDYDADACVSLEELVQPSS